MSIKLNPSVYFFQKRAYVKIYNGETKWMYLFYTDYYLLKIMVIFERKSAIVLKNNLIANPSKMKKNFLKTKIKSYSDGATDFHG